MKGAIIYRGKYGATQVYATLLSHELDLPLFEETITGGQLMQEDYLLIGSAVYAGRLSLHNWLLRQENWLRTKKLFFFIVCATPAEAKDKTAKIIADNIPLSLQHHPIVFLKGRMILHQLSWIDRQVLRLGALLNPDKEESKKMLQDFDGVHAEQLAPLTQAVHLWQTTELEKQVTAPATTSLHNQ